MLVEELGGNGPFKLIEPKIQVLERRQRQNHIGELAYKTIVAQVKLMKQLHAAKAGGNNTTEAVGVKVKECKIGEAAKLWREIASNVGVIEVYAGDNSDFGIGRRGSTVDSHVRADIRAIPVGCEVERV